MIHYKLVTIEHFKAQASPPLSPVFRLFKAVGYTEQQPGGMKGQSLGNDFAAGGGGNLVGLNGNAELNPVGIIVFSLFRGGRLLRQPKRYLHAPYRVFAPGLLFTAIHRSECTEA